MNLVSVAQREEAATAAQLLGACYPDADCELDFASPYQLLVATVLSAQSTDRRVNQVTPELFTRYPDATALALAERETLERIIHPTGFFRAKTDSLIRMSEKLVAEHEGEIPATMNALVALPGVGRKTANVVLGNAFGVPGLTPDTHFMRVSRRLGWTKSTRPDAVESDVAALFDPDQWVIVSHQLIWHGRRRCHARRPACGVCPVADLCPSFGEGPTDLATAEALVREPRR